MNRPEFEYKAPPIKTSQFNTPVSFFRTVEDDGPEPGAGNTEQVFDCMCLAYEASNKDRAVLNVNEVKYGLTIKIWDTFGEYDPSTTDTAVLDDRRYLDVKGQPIIWDVISVAHDLENNRIVKIVLGVTR
ncbi:gp8 protein [Lactobacillus plantarum JDM1] [Lactiplantibacillus mudanjiangensis]|uniref:hypothetical protein n=1 Tax=Lactiplantibacillus mudanjiangensis TaxID=1296538 RepID=UPI0010153C36|nr:gp8 protein [Lactobacillus plantarum JDM1] [Lactiplantibacillus mudanjiangensis]